MENLYLCPSCGSSNIIFFIQCKDYTVSNSQFIINQCIGCTLKFTNPRPGQKEIGPYYDSNNYISHSDVSKGLLNSLYKIVRQYTVKQKVKLIKCYLSPGSSILDYGAGTGFFLKILSKAGYNIAGIEPSEQARKIAKEKHNLELMSVDKLQCADLQSINCITLWHVLEHIHPLKEAISRFHTLLERNGYLIIAVPNTESYDAKYYKENWAAYDVPRHLYHFSPESINNLITPIGFKLLKTLPMYFDSTYVSILSEKHMTINNKKPSGSICIIKGIFRGLTSNLYGLVNYSNYSSLIYIYRKEF